MRSRTIIRYALAAILVMVLGALSGWYIVLRRETTTTQASDQARGYDTSAPVAVQTGAGGGSGGASASGGNFTPPSNVSETNSSQGGWFSRMYNTVFGISPPLSTDLGASGIQQATDFSTDTVASSTTQRPPELWRVTATPVAGIHFIRNGAGIILRYVERQSGYVVDANPATGGIVRRTNTLMPKTYEAFLSQSGRVTLRTLDQGDVITTFTGKLSTSTATTTQDLKGIQLGADLTRFAVDEKTDAILYVVESETGGSIMKAGPDGSKPQKLLDSAIANWRLLPLADGRLIIVEEPADGIMGHAYELRSGALAQVVAATPGLTVLPRASSTALVYSSARNGDLSLFGQVNADASSVRLPVHTITEKCAWSPSASLLVYCGVPQGATTGKFLDDWHRGATHTTDALYSVDVSAGTAKIIYAPDNNTFDVEDLAVDPSGSYLAFVNGVDMSLYVVRLTP